MKVELLDNFHENIQQDYFIKITSAVFDLWLKQRRYNALSSFNRRPAMMQMQDRNKYKTKTISSYHINILFYEFM
jgi:hypothetical protein